jgi:ankyrin repeat protein
MLINRPCVWQKVCRRRWGCQTLCEVKSRLFRIVGQAEYHPALVDIAPLIKAGADLSSTYGPQKVTPLLMAAYHGHLNVVKFLVKCGSSLKDKSVYGRSALLCAAWGGHLQVVAWLYHNGCDPAERDQFGHTPLLCAAMSGSRSTCAWLRDQGAQLTERNRAGFTPLHCASFMGSHDLVNWMLATGSSISEKSISDDTPLLCACRSAQLCVVKLLLAKGASFQERSNVGENGIMLAALGKPQGNDMRHANLVGRSFCCCSCCCCRRCCLAVLSDSSCCSFCPICSMDSAPQPSAGRRHGPVRVHRNAHGARERQHAGPQRPPPVWRPGDCAQQVWRNACR